ncbi:cytochrome c biogenesis heme-transporting ATPase CcmA [Inmirania thermothiophila]|uniref:cytochrome c biogenesis heme-transporting ATPase CcmA n=1 Tax=Inmirania thermothiophila TaxID=1750597 RepID=UPI000F4767AD|nr:cytochrome c biogenesis heme-transporting ATPase CcmA [Inmirania thermothiophila]
MLEAEGLVFVREDRVLFEDLGFALHAGEALQVEGPNGSGKTTLLRVLCGLALPEEGEVRWRGTDIRRARSEYLAELAYIGHQHGVKGELTPRENLAVACALGGRRDGVEADEALARMGLSGYEDVPCRTLSAGQRRRVALARLLLTPARLWILDEPFTALDRGGRRDIERLISQHLAQGGLAVFTTHHAVALDGAEARVVHLGA